MKNWASARRDLLRTLGLSAAFLPLLRASRARAQQPLSAGKLICVQAIQGYRQMQWLPAMGSLLTQTLPSSSAPLEPHKSDLIFATGLHNLGGGAANYSYGTVFYGLGGTGNVPYKEPAGKTLDQVVADAVPTPPGGRPSYAFGVQLDLLPRTTTQPGGNFCFWTGPGQPIMPQLDPLAAYQALFAGPQGDPAELKRLRVQRKSVLDYVGGSLRRFAGRVGTEDERIIHQHLQSLREIETRLDRVSTPGCATQPAVVDIKDNSKYANILSAHLDLMVAALSCGMTRVVTLQLADANGFSINYGHFVPEIPPRSYSAYKSPYRNWADLGHNPVAGGVDHKAIVDRWWMQRLADLIAKLKATPDANGGSLFDNTITVWANPVNDGAQKDARKMPWIVAGRGGGVLKTGQHHVGGPSKGVMATVCKALNVTGPYGEPTPGLTG